MSQHVYNTSEAAKLLGVSRQMVSKLCSRKNPQLEHCRIGKRIVITRDAIESFLESKRITVRKASGRPRKRLTVNDMDLSLYAEIAEFL